jgi:hypothetical protein
MAARASPLGLDGGGPHDIRAVVRAAAHPAALLFQAESDIVEQFSFAIGNQDVDANC